MQGINIKLCNSCNHSFRMNEFEDKIICSDCENYQTGFKEGYEKGMKERHDRQVDKMPIEKNNTNLDLLPDVLKDQTYTPQVGEECEARSVAIDVFGWEKCKIIADHESQYWMSFDDIGKSEIYYKGHFEFRPLKTERDKLLEQAVSDIVGDSKTQHVSLKDSEQIGKLIDAGWRPTK